MTALKKLIENTKATASKDTLQQVIQECIRQFPENKLLRKVDNNSFTMNDYHSILKMIFHQTFNGPGYLALAGSNCRANHLIARDYLFHHAEEEKTHWTWVLNDLKNTGYQGPDPRTEFAPEPCQAYLAYNFYVASKMPLGRLAIATMLESLGAACGKRYAQRFTKLLNLTPEQATFFFGHGDTDVAHTRDLWQVLEASQLSTAEWAEMINCAVTAYKMYFRMYDESAG